MDLNRKKAGGSTSQMWRIKLGMISMMILVYALGCLQNDDAVQNEPAHRALPELLGTDETCVKCHGNVSGFAPGHLPGAIGCASCHLGDPKAESKEEAHKSMVLIPGNLENASATCGNASCHPDIVDRVSKSLMTTMAGVVSTNRHVFDPGAPSLSNPHIETIRDDHPADTHLRQLCASCHLGREKTSFGPIDETSRGGGCTACHLNYADTALTDLKAYVAGDKEGKLLYTHPGLTVEVTNDHCFGCHSRSGRISTSYEGWHETTLHELTGLTDSTFRELQDGRIFQKYAADIHHERGLECIDCHLVTELMGDGNTYRHKSEALKVQCADCHFSGSKETIPFDALSDEEKKILNIRGKEPGAYLPAGRSGEALLNSSVLPDGRALLFGKNSRDTFELRPPADVCQKDAVHSRLTCESCHTGWAPQCLGCHTSYDPLITGYDLLDQKKVTGKWNESIGVFLAEAPPLGIVMEKHEGMEVEKIKTFIAGMIMTIDPSGFPGHGEDTTMFRRLFAPVSAHTTQAGGRSCASCHLDPLALGYGRGTLEYQTESGQGKWVFESEYVANDQDGLPEDAWIPFLGTREGMTSSRSVARPFTVEEQQRILLVGACLTCHEEKSTVMESSLEGFEGVLERRSSVCILPGSYKKR